MKNEMKKTKGITLVALVVTIVVLLILAGITINLLMNEDGIFKLTQKAKESTEIEGEEEQLQLIYIDALAQNVGKGTLTAEKLIQILEDSKLDITVEPYTGISNEESVKVTFNKTGKTYTLSTLGNINGESEYHKKAVEKVKELTLDEKISQMLMVHYYTDKTTNAFGGILFFEKDFTGKTEVQVKTMLNELNNTSNIPFLTAVDEEGKTGTQGVIRVSSNPNLIANNTYLNGNQFQSSQTLYANGGFPRVKQDTIEKSKFLYNLGLNLNLAPVLDIAQESNYIYHRTVGLDAEGTSKFANSVIEGSIEAQKQGYQVSYCLKHFPGYGNNSDTHLGFSVDTRTLEQVKTDMKPFEAGIQSGAEAVLISHNIVSSVDADNAASLSPAIHNLLRNDLHFKGVIITDALEMGAVNDIEGKFKKAVLAGNDILIVTNGTDALNEIKTAVNNGEITEEMITEAATRVIEWKYKKNMMQ